MQIKIGCRAKLGVTVIFLFLISGHLYAEPYNYYDEYVGSEKERRKGTRYYYSEMFERSRSGRQRAGTNYYYPDQYDISQSNVERSGTNYYYENQEEKSKKYKESAQLKDYFKNLGQDRFNDFFTKCIGNKCYIYNQKGELLSTQEIKKASQ